MATARIDGNGRLRLIRGGESIGELPALCARRGRPFSDQAIIETAVLNAETASSELLQQSAFRIQSSRVFAMESPGGSPADEA